MIRILAIAALLLAAPALAKGKKKAKRKPAPAPAAIVHPFADVPLAKLQVADTRGAKAVIENKDGDVVLVSAGDKLGEEAFEVVKVSLGCVTLKGPDADLTLCADVPEVPRT